MTQDTALNILKTGANVFLTGEPGSGKTHTINRYIEWLRARGIEPAVTASTGIAATHIGGYTIHSWTGLGVRTTLTPYELEALHEKEYLWRRITKTNVLIIEEISMIDAQVLDTVDTILRNIRSMDRPMGGMHVVFVGDFFQLPPVQKEGEAAFAYHSRAWQEANPVVCYLTEQHRQEDADFLELLSALRAERVTESHMEQLTRRKYVTEEGGDTTATNLYAHNADVDRINEAQIAELAASERTYTMEYAGPKALTAQLIRGCLSPETLVLKEGAVVMFTKNNFDEGFANGTLGTVTGFSENGMPVVATREGRTIEVPLMEWTINEDGKVRARITQVPLRLAWAITVHKSQGMSLDAAVVDLSHAFEYGQGYVALSRVRSFSGLFLRGFNERALEVHPDVSRQNARLLQYSEAAEAKFGQLSAEDITRRQKAFVASLGGSWEAVEKHTRKKKAAKQPTHEITGALLAEGKGATEIAEERGLALSTIFTHLEKLRRHGTIGADAVAHLWEETGRSPEELDGIHEVFFEYGDFRLRPVRERFNEEFTFEELRIARLLLPEGE